ncbi:MAG: hypothetical protein ABGY08_05300 [Gammaproteobacteria bacterium]
MHAAEQLAHAYKLEIITSLPKPLQLMKLQLLLEQYNEGDIIPRKFIAQPTGFEITVDGLRQTIGDDQLILHYQPQIDIASGKIIGLEARALATP